MRSLDVVVHASTEPEPFGMVIIEGMACRRAVIASQAGGASELFVDEQTALGHPPGDETVLAQCIQQLASDPELRQRIGEAGRRAAERHYEGKRLAQELLAVYCGIGGQPVQLPSEGRTQSSLPVTAEQNFRLRT
jgi:glycosyltransferase involved in cell wall biosynthesis